MCILAVCFNSGIGIREFINGPMSLSFGGGDFAVFVPGAGCRKVCFWKTRFGTALSTGFIAWHWKERPKERSGMASSIMTMIRGF